MHKQGHVIISKYEMDPNKERTKLLHGWAGNMARADTNSSKALKNKMLTVVEIGAEKHKSKLDVAHPKRFSCWRWEAQITEFKEDKHNTGWQQVAHDRIRWKISQSQKQQQHQIQKRAATTT